MATYEDGNSAPVLTGTQAVPQPGATDTVYTVTREQLLQGFTDADGDALSVIGLTANRGTVVENPDGSWSITPTTIQSGALVLSYGVSDGTATTAATLSVVGFIGVASGGKMNGTAASEVFYGKGGTDILYGGGGDDLMNGGGNNDQLFGYDGNDTLDGNAGSDLVDGGTGNDLLVYRLAENTGLVDAYSGNTGNDTLRLELTAAEWGGATVQSEVARYVAHLASVPRTNGEVAAGTGLDFTFNFGGSTLKVQMVENLQLSVDGQPVDASLALLYASTDVTVF